MGHGVIESYIWSFFNRFVHVVMIVSFALAYCVQDFLPIHIFFGTLFGAAVVLRIVWGFVGTKHSRFADFPYRGVLGYLASVFGAKRRFVGHNPASSWAILLMLFLGICTAISGMLEAGISKNQGIFAFLHDQYSRVRFLDDVHEMFANALLLVVCVHILGALIDWLVHKNDSVASMISGFKKTEGNESIAPNIGQRIFGFVGIALLAAIAVFMLGDNPLTKSHAQRIDYAGMNKDFANECGSCHAIYPPFLLPKHSWALMMDDLENHFGDDASIDSELNAEILAFLEKYSAESFDTKVARNIIERQTDSANIAITKNPYWIERHAHIAEDVFAQPSVKTKANCFACHKDLEHGILTLAR